MIIDRLAIRLGPKHLHSVTLGISHLIEQQYAQKLSDEEFIKLETILAAAHNRGRQAALIPWYDSFEYSGDSAEISHIVSSSAFLGSSTTGSIKTELVPKDPAEPLNYFINYLFTLTEEVDEQGTPYLFKSLTDEQKKHIHYCIKKVVNGNINVDRKKDLETLAENCNKSL